MNLEEARSFAEDFFGDPRTAESMMASDATFDFPGTMQLAGRSKIEQVFSRAPKQGIESTTHSVSNICLGEDDQGCCVITVELNSVYELTRSPTVTLRGLSMLRLNANGGVSEWLFCTDSSPLNELVGMARDIGSASAR